MTTSMRGLFIGTVLMSLLAAAIVFASGCAVRPLEDMGPCERKGYMQDLASENWFLTGTKAGAEIDSLVEAGKIVPEDAC